MRQIDNQQIWSGNVRCGILNSRIIGTYVFEETLNGAIYHNFQPFANFVRKSGITFDDKCGFNKMEHPHSTRADKKLYKIY